MKHISLTAIALLIPISCFAELGAEYRGDGLSLRIIELEVKGPDNSSVAAELKGKKACGAISGMGIASGSRLVFNNFVKPGVAGMPECTVSVNFNEDHGIGTVTTSGCGIWLGNSCSIEGVVRRKK